MNIIQKIDEMLEERSLLKHPFYQMWSDGKLTKESLAGYSKEYFQLVKAVPAFMTPIIEKASDAVVGELVENQQEESDHIKPWIAFAGELGISEDELISYSGTTKTQKAVSDLNQLMVTFDGVHLDVMLSHSCLLQPHISHLSTIFPAKQYSGFKDEHSPYSVPSEHVGRGVSPTSPIMRMISSVQSVLTSSPPIVR